MVQDVFVAVGLTFSCNRDALKESGNEMVEGFSGGIEVEHWLKMD